MISTHILITVQQTSNRLCLGEHSSSMKVYWGLDCWQNRQSLNSAPYCNIAVGKAQFLGQQMLGCTIVQNLLLPFDVQVNGQI